MITIRLQTRWETNYTDFLLFILTFEVGKHSVFNPLTHIQTSADQKGNTPHQKAGFSSKVCDFFS